MPPRSRRVYPKRGRATKASPKGSHRYRSGYEATIGSFLDTLRIPFEYETRQLRYTTEHQYKPDFILNKTDGSVMFVETKGYFQPSDRTKTLAVLKENPGIDLRFLFLRATNKLNRGSNTTYAMWCDKHGIPWAEGETLPSRWLKEVERDAGNQGTKRKVANRKR